MFFEINNISPRGSPACAGIVQDLAELVQNGTRFPRVRGDSPLVVQKVLLLAPVPPRARG
ncbi:Hypothetical protein GbCGDNIH7_10014 [Granulibacter bethesdensis]|nr:Hypothetical protein GbCGDNIH7_10014 [Granulibacter bethesdensis]